jgi:DNA end-binding protein Ku
MAHAIWKGSISFGLVNIPVSLFSATTDRSIRFNQFEAGTTDRVRNLRVNERTGKEVAYEDIVKGYDVGGHEYVLIEPDELEELAPKRSTSIEISDFVDLEDIDPIFFRSTYVLGPATPSASKAYGLLHRALSDSEKVGVSTFVMRGKENLCVLRAHREALLLETLAFPDEIRAPGQVLDEPLEITEPTERELTMAMQLVDSMSAKWDPSLYEDTYRADVEALIERKRQGQPLVSNSAGEQLQMAPIVDLMEALEASVSGAKRSRRGSDDSRADDGSDARVRTAAKRSAKTTSAPAPKAVKTATKRRAAPKKAS